MNSGNQRFYRSNSLVVLNETESGWSLPYSIAEILETTSEHAVVQMFTSDDNVTCRRTEERKNISLTKIIVSNIAMTKKNSLRQKAIESMHRLVNIYQ